MLDEAPPRGLTARLLLLRAGAAAQSGDLRAMAHALAAAERIAVPAPDLYAESLAAQAEYASVFGRHAEALDLMDRVVELSQPAPAARDWEYRAHARQLRRRAVQRQATGATRGALADLDAAREVLAATHRMPQNDYAHVLLRTAWTLLAVPGQTPRAWVDADEAYDTAVCHGLVPEQCWALLALG